jgi:hypothetical protein
MNALNAKVRGTLSVFTGLCVVLIAATATAQDAQDAPRRGWETGVDIYTGVRAGEAAFYAGAFGGNNGLAFRFSTLDETDVIPCSVGVMYEYVGFRHASARVKPTAGVSANRIFSCASAADAIRRPSPPMHGSRLLTAGVRIPMFKGSNVAGSLKVMGFAGRTFGHTAAADANTKGIVFGAVIHAP